MLTHSITPTSGVQLKINHVLFNLKDLHSRITTTPITNLQYYAIMGKHMPDSCCPDHYFMFYLQQCHEFCDRLNKLRILGLRKAYIDIAPDEVSDWNDCPVWTWDQKVLSKAYEECGDIVACSAMQERYMQYYGHRSYKDINPDIAFSVQPKGKLGGLFVKLEFDNILFHPLVTNNLMLSVAIGDISGSWYELKGNGTKQWLNVNLLRTDTDYTDDTVCAFACAEALYNGTDVGQNLWLRCREDMQRGYGNRFRQWLEDDNRTPYVSEGSNGSAMRCMAAGILSRTVEECKQMVLETARPTHNHPDCIRGAEAIALAIFYLLRGKDKQFIQERILHTYYPQWPVSYDEIMKTYQFSCQCNDTVPLALVCFIQSYDYISCLKMCIGTMGDSDTLAAMASPLAYIYYRELPQPLIDLAKSKLPQWMLDVNDIVVPDYTQLVVDDAAVSAQAFVSPSNPKDYYLIFPQEDEIKKQLWPKPKQ